jgi:membrane dipeptidase
MTSSTPSRGYVDTLGFLGDVALPLFDPRTLENVRRSGVTLFHLTSAMPFQDWRTTTDQIDRAIGRLKAHADRFLVIQSASDLASLPHSSKVGVIPGIQDPGFIEDRLERVQDLFDRGIRIMQAAYQQTGPYGAGFLAEDRDRGLTPLGREFVEAVQNAGMILDLSHLSPRTALECTETASGPVMITHTSARDLYPHPRGSRDDLLRALAQRRDTLVGVLAMTFFLDPSDDSMGPWVRHIRHIAEIVGPDRVAVGSDGPIGGFTDLESAENSFKETMQGLLDPDGRLGSRWPTHIPAFAHGVRGFETLARALEPEFEPTDIAGILGENGYRWFAGALPGSDLRGPVPSRRSQERREGPGSPRHH